MAFVAYLRRARSAIKVITRRQLFQGLGAATIGGVGLSGYALAEGFGTGVTNYRLSPPRWPQGLSVKLAVIADLHACKPWMDVERIEGIVAQVNGLAPDAVLLLGDYVAGGGMARYSRRPSPTVIGPAHWPAFGRRSACTPCSAITIGGRMVQSWSAAAAGRPRLVIALQNAGIRCTRTPASACSQGWAPFLARRARRSMGLRAPEALGRIASYDGVDDLAGTLALATDDAPIVLMAHEPDIFPRVPDRVALTVCGHTHGGQVRLIGYAPVRALEVRRPLRLWPYRRRRPQPHRLRRSRLLRSARALRRAA